jgi:hypothetical protein
MTDHLFGGHPPYQRHSKTSLQAANQIKEPSKSLREQVYGLLKALGENGATDEEIGIALNLPGNTVRPRRRELQLQDRIEITGKTRKTQSGRAAAVWVVKP